MEVHQFSTDVSSGDGVSNQLFSIRKILRQAGFSSEIYVENINDPKLKDELKSIHQYAGNANNILVIHHAFVCGVDTFDKIVNLPDRKMLFFHNITPERFFVDPMILKYTRLGWKQLRDFCSYIDYAIATSNYTRREMVSYGYKNVDVLPQTATLEEFMSRSTDNETESNNRNNVNILFVGRVVPHKCHDDIIRCFAHYAYHHNPGAKLYLVGDTSLEEYVSYLRDLCAQLEVSDSVVFTGKVGNTVLKAYYKVADVFLCMSEHEGFGVPLLEAMAMDIPVIAYRSSAVPETMDGAGILLDTKQAGVVGELINTVLKNDAWKQEIVDKQRQRIARLANIDIKDILLRAIHHVRQNIQPPLTVQIQEPLENCCESALNNNLDA